MSADLVERSIDARTWRISGLLTQTDIYMFVRDSPMTPHPHFLTAGCTLAITRGREAGTDQRAFCILFSSLQTKGPRTKNYATKFDSHHCRNIGAAFCPVSLNRVGHHQPPKLAFPPETDAS